MRNESEHSLGFTLVEMSIVLIVIALITAGIMGGRSLIRSAEIKSVISDFNQFSSAIKLFKDQYNALPGDMRNATDYWPGVPGNGNGNGDGIFDSMFEQIRLWQQLALAGIIPGHYDGINTSSSPIAGVNAPKSGMSGAYFSVQYYGSASNTVYKQGGNYIKLEGTTVTPAEAQTIDRAIDDGIGNVGRILGVYKGGGMHCTRDIGGGKREYRVDETERYCRPFLRFGDAGSGL